MGVERSERQAIMDRLDSERSRIDQILGSGGYSGNGGSGGYSGAGYSGGGSGGYSGASSSSSIEGGGGGSMSFNQSAVVSSYDT